MSYEKQPLSNSFSLGWFVIYYIMVDEVNICDLIRLIVNLQRSHSQYLW